MAVKDRTTKMANIDATVREIDFVSRFAERWQGLIDIMGISRPVQKQPGAMLTRKKGVITLQSGNVAEGDEIPYSLAGVEEDTPEPITIEKYAKGVSIEAINKHGYDVAVQKTDDAFLFELQRKVMDKFYGYLDDGNMTHIETDWQMGLAMAKGLVDNEFRKMKLESQGTVGFVNILDFYRYLGNATITVQNQFGYNYVRDFMGYRVIFLCSADEVAAGKIYATAVENIVPYYVDPGDSDFARAGLEFTVDGDTPFVGFHTEGNYSHAVSESYAIMGLKLWAEYLNGIAVVTIEASGSIGAVTATSAAGTTAGTKITITAPAQSAWKDDWIVKVMSAAAPTAPSYKDDISGWDTLAVENGVADNVVLDGAKVVVAIANGSGQAIYTSSAITVTNKA